MSDNKIDLTVLKVGLLGDSMVGKTSICNSYMGLEFNQDMLSTIGIEKLDKKITLKSGKEIKLILWDTAGQERFRSAALKAVRSAQGVVLVFDVTKKETFDNISDWMTQIKDNFKNPSVVLFGNKADIAEDKWEVKRDEIADFVKNNNFIYYETSAKTKKGLDDGFNFIANDIYEKLQANDNSQFHIEDDNEYEIVNGCFGKKKKIKKKKKNKK
jgi:small GTP-binding protein